MTEPPIVFYVPPESGGLRLSLFLSRSGVSLSAVRGLKCVEDGITVNGQRARTSLMLAEGDVVELRPGQSDGYSARPEAISLKMVYQSQHALVIDKPAGMATHPDPSHHSGTLANAVCGLYQKQGRAGAFRPMGRLDANTSGLVLCAQNGVAAHLLGQTAQKLYLALVHGALADKEGLIDAPLGPKPGSRLVQWVSPQGRPSQTIYRVLSVSPQASLVAALPQTGRTHQIRAHLAHLGHPLLGDDLYGGSTAVIKRHALHCAGLRFVEISGNCPTLWSGLPVDMQLAALHMGLAVPALPLTDLLADALG